MVDVVFRNDGILDKYIGDAIMAVFGAPLTTPRDADNAVKAAIEMTWALRQFNAQRAERGLQPIDIGVGLSSGHVIAGSIGSEKRLDYTVIGDCVNLAARLESATKYYGTKVLMSDQTLRQLQTPRPMREIDLLRVKGRQQPIAVFEPLEYLPDQARADLMSVLPEYKESIKLYRQQRWSEALELLDKVLAVRPEDRPSLLHRDRCLFYQTQPPEQPWDGVWNLTEK